MRILRPQHGNIPHPRPTAVSQPFWDGLRLQELRFQRCGSCGRAVHSPSTICSNCWSTSLSWEVSSGRGEVYSWTVVRRPISREFEVPYAPVIIDMAEGWQMLSSLVGCADDEIRIGMPVQVIFHVIEGDFVLPYFEPV